MTHPGDPAPIDGAAAALLPDATIGRPPTGEPTASSAAPSTPPASTAAASPSASTTASPTAPSPARSTTVGPRPSATRIVGRVSRASARWTAVAVTRVVELALIVLGMGAVFDQWSISELELLFWFDLIALTYLTGGLIVVRRQRRPTTVDELVRRDRWRFDLLFAVTAALIGLYAALAVAVEDADPELAAETTFLGVLTVAVSWLLLHAGHARRYRNLFARYGGGLEWPVATPNPAAPPAHRPAPRLLDFVYFAYSVGSSFGATDVMVTERPMRWAVLVHSVLSFFFNAAVLAFLISRISSM